MENKIGILGVPVETAQPFDGLSKAPDFIRGLDLTSNIEKLGYIVCDYGNMHVEYVSNDDKSYNALLPQTFANNVLKCKGLVEEAIKENQFLIVLGGDRTVCTGSILAHSKVDKDCCIIYVGRKPNLHTILSASKGHMNEMSLFLLISEMQVEIPWLTQFNNITPTIPAKNIAFVGLNQIDNFEKYMINKHNIKAMTTCEIDRLGMEAVIRECLMTINPKLDKSIHLCLNIDALDPLYAPSVSDSTFGGLTLREAIVIGEYLSNTGKLKVMDIVEFNPELGSEKENQKTRLSIISTILASLGSKRPGIPAIDPNFYDWVKSKLPRVVKF